MTPGARVAAAIGLLAAIEAGRAPADDIVGGYFRRHRFAGVKDRAAISAHIYAVLRHRAALDWWMARAGGGTAPAARPRLLAALVLIEEWTPEAVARACDGDRFRPAPLDPRERAMLASLAGRDLLHRDMPAPVRGNYPDWLEPHLGAALGRDLAREMAAMQDEAQLDLRANRLKTGREGALAALAAEGVEAGRTRLSPLGLRVFARIPLATLECFRRGLVEVQDEGAQLAALLVDAQPGMRVADFCAGAGGKTLALAAAMENRGHLVACDIAERRLERATERLRRAGASIVQRHALASARDKWVKRHGAGFDRVLVDAPCTGTGTWRRNPDAKWRLTPGDLAELTALQADILDSAARLVRPGGRLVYVTCSLLNEENEAQVARFLAAHGDFALMPVAPVWAATVGGDCPAKGEMLRLTPLRHGTDGFFVAIMGRRAAAADSRGKGLRPLPPETMMAGP
ncbi:MAG TPA: RsmB/NOP family class I SAM-dependent RNA methyltransferase [Stellaceae bacterium]|nr:RsmB/NOP family class I SAM-dependent RNA methyltransferase [Stellaceae bacterium]